MSPRPMKGGPALHRAREEHDDGLDLAGPVPERALDPDPRDARAGRDDPEGAPLSPSVEQPGGDDAVRGAGALGRGAGARCARCGRWDTRRYFYVVEFQRETEQAHFHLLVDASYIPKAAIDDAWSKLRPKAAGPPAPNRPAFGMTRFSVRKFDGGPVHAARYATKYLVKAPEHGFPAWVLAMGAVQRLPRYRASRGFWGRPTRPRREPQSERTVTPRTYEQRRTECGTACDLFGLDEHVNELTGEVIRLRNWESRLAIDGGIIGVISPAAKPGARRTTLIASGVSACIASLELAAGEPIRVISGRGVDRRTLR